MDEPFVESGITLQIQSSVMIVVQNARYVVLMFSLKSERVRKQATCKTNNAQYNYTCECMGLHMYMYAIN